jgi:hypothetical protein
MHLAKFVPNHLDCIDAVDVAKPGMGRVWFVPDAAPPVLWWWASFPTHIQDRLVTNQNPSGNLSISNFELAGVVAHQDILAKIFNASECTFSLLNDHLLPLVTQPNAPSPAAMPPPSFFGDSPASMNGITATSFATTTLLDSPMPWPMLPLIFGPCLTHNCLHISNRLTLSHLLQPQQLLYKPFDRCFLR